MQVNAGCRREDIYTEVSYTILKTLILEYTQRANWNNYTDGSPIVGGCRIDKKVEVESVLIRLSARLTKVALNLKVRPSARTSRLSNIDATWYFMLTISAFASQFTTNQ